MNRELQEYYEARFELFASKGWKDLIEDIDARIEAIQNIRGIKDECTLFTRQGELDCLDWIKSLPDLSTQAYETLQEEENAKSII